MFPSLATNGANTVAVDSEVSSAESKVCVCVCVFWYHESQAAVSVLRRCIALETEPPRKGLAYTRRKLLNEAGCICKGQRFGHRPRRTKLEWLFFFQSLRKSTRQFARQLHNATFGNSEQNIFN